MKFPNEVKGCWNAKRPLEIVVSDMTIFKHKGVRWEWTLDNSQESRHKKVKNIQEQTKNSAPSIELPSRLE